MTFFSKSENICGLISYVYQLRPESSSWLCLFWNFWQKRLRNLLILNGSFKDWPSYFEKYKSFFMLIYLDCLALSVRPSNSKVKFWIRRFTHVKFAIDYRSESFSLRKNQTFLVKILIFSYSKAFGFRPQVQMLDIYYWICALLSIFSRGY